MAEEVGSRLGRGALVQRRVPRAAVGGEGFAVNASPPGTSAPTGPPVDATGIAVRFGVLGGVLSSAFIVLPPAFGAGGRLTDYAGMMVAMLAVFFGSRAIGTAHPSLGFGRRVVLGTTIVVVASAIVGLALYALYAKLRPTLLAERYVEFQQRVRASGAPAERVATELERLGAQKAQYLDPAFQALGTAGTLAFFGIVLATYSAWRWRVLQRLKSGPRGPDGPASR
jgi:hypothetical protein